MKLRHWIPFDKGDWTNLSKNPNAIPILEKNMDKMNTRGWKHLSMIMKQ